MINCSLREYENKIVLYYNLNFLNLEKQLTFQSNNQYNFSIEINPILSLSWTRDSGSGYVLLHIELYNGATRLSTPTYTEKYKEEFLEDIVDCVQDSFKSSIVSHLEFLTNGSYLFVDKMLEKWPDVNIDEVKQRFGEKHINKTLTATIMFSKLLPEVEFESKWKVHSTELMMKRDIPKNKVIEKVKKF